MERGEGSAGTGRGAVLYSPGGRVAAGQAADAPVLAGAGAASVNAAHSGPVNAVKASRPVGRTESPDCCCDCLGCSCCGTRPARYALHCSRNRRVFRLPPRKAASRLAVDPLFGVARRLGIPRPSPISPRSTSRMCHSEPLRRIQHAEPLGGEESLLPRQNWPLSAEIPRPSAYSATCRAVSFRTQ